MATWFARRAVLSAGRPAVSDGGTGWTYAEMQQRIERFAAVLYREGIRTGDRVGFLGFNCPDLLVTFFASASLGAIFVPLNFRLTPSELTFIINDSGIAALIVGSEHVHLIEAAKPNLSCRSYIQAGDGKANWPTLEKLLSTASAAAPRTLVASSDVAAILYTSGTTGRPKGAMLTHANIWANNVNLILGYGITGSDSCLTTAPMFHAGGLFAFIMSVLLVRGHAIIHRGFDPRSVITTIEAQRVSITFGVPTMVLELTRCAEYASSDLSSLRLFVVGGAPIPEPLLRMFSERGIPVASPYGMTEVVSAATFLETELAAAKLGSVGRSMLLNEIKLVDAQGRDIIDPAIDGEVCVRGDIVMPGYWNLPQESAEAISEDGWFRTGDLGRLDEDGFLFICGRAKDMVISGGENVYPAEVESVLLDHPAIANVAVVGTQDEKWGERVVAFAILKDQRPLSLDDLRDFCRGRLASYKQPKELRIVSELPQNGAGKIQKHILRQMLASKVEQET
jgi:fatty-acyl-CoA synthase